MSEGEQEDDRGTGVAFTRTEPALRGVLEELRALEPLFHCEAFGRSEAAFAERMAEGYWEVGASGRRYSREFILRHLREVPPGLAVELGWACWDFAVRRLGPEVYLLTYCLAQGPRQTRRTSVWTRGEQGWQVLYHQGTLISGGADDEMAT